ncbi:E3 ISG15--protein ligase HERC5 [Plecturocebus cupreus]
MERRSRRKSRRDRPSVAGQAAESQPAKSLGAQLRLCPSTAGLCRELLRRVEATRQICCSPGRLAFLERGGAGVQFHQLLPGSNDLLTAKYMKLGKNMTIHSMDLGADRMLIVSSDGKLFEYDNYSMKHISKLVQMFKTAIICQLDYWNENAEENGNVQALLEMLKKLHRRVRCSRQRQLQRKREDAGALGWRRRPGEACPWLPEGRAQRRRLWDLAQSLGAVWRLDLETPPAPPPLPPRLSGSRGLKLPSQPDTRSFKNQE